MASSGCGVSNNIGCTSSGSCGTTGSNSNSNSKLINEKVVRRINKVAATPILVLGNNPSSNSNNLVSPKTQNLNNNPDDYHNLNNNNNSTSNNVSNEMPQWKKELIQRRKQKSNNHQVLLQLESPTTATFGSNHDRQLSPSAVKSRGGVFLPISQLESSPSPSSQQHLSASSYAAPVVSNNNNNTGDSEIMRLEDNHLNSLLELANKMRGDDSDSSEELQYGPGIVDKLKHKYLNLTMRETNKTSFRKAASLEDLIEPQPEENGKKYVKKCNGTVNNKIDRFRNASRGNDSMKRARSVETLMRRSNVDQNDQIILVSTYK